MAINHTEKGPGLILAVERAGHWLICVDGVWQSSDDDAVQAIIDSYVEPVPDLTPAQFAFLLALTGLDDVWANLETTLKASDRAQYAMLYAQKFQKRFVFDVTMAMVSRFAAFVPPETDLSEPTIRAAWMQAHQQSV